MNHESLPINLQTVGTDEFVPVMRPKLAATDRVVPYLRRIDVGRTYSNWGPLNAEFEQRLGTHMGVEDGCVVSAASGTAAIAGAVLAFAGRATIDKPLAILPSLTFTGTAAALEQCGYQLFFADIDPLTWVLDADQLMRRTSKEFLKRIGVVVPVAAFGRSLPQEPWQRFQQATGIPVVIDGAASFEAICRVPLPSIGRLPVAISFHATKSLGTGEGGCVVLDSPNSAVRVMQCLNFGFGGSRECTVSGINGKLSEYHAAVGLAELDYWDEKLCAADTVASLYRERMIKAGLGDRLIATPLTGSAYVLFVCSSATESQRIQEQLSLASIGFRLWYGLGLHRHAFWADSEKEALPTTEDLAPRIIGLPFAVDLQPEVVDRIVSVLLRAMRN